MAQEHKTRGGVKAWASKPFDADEEFIRLAKKHGLQLLCTASLDGDNETFFLSNDRIVCKKNEYLVILEDGCWFVISNCIFDSLFEPVGNSGKLPPQSSASEKLEGLSFLIDAGHGGADPGACNEALGLQEKVAALDIAFALGKELEAHGAKVHYSRTSNDVKPGITARANQANNLGVDALISIHLNSAANKTANGIETLCYANKGNGGRLATLVQNQLVKTTKWRDRGVKERPDLGVLRLSKMVAILIEVGFISNDEEAKKLFEKETQRKLANAICQGVMEYYR